MKAGTFNIDEYLNKLYETADDSEEDKDESKEVKEVKEDKEEKSSSFKSDKFSTSSKDTVQEDGIIIPAENKKFYSWLKGEYQKGKTEVKVEMNVGGAKFEPGYEMQSPTDSVKEFKPGMYGEVKTADTKGSKPINKQISGLSKPVENQKDNQLQKTKPITVKSEFTNKKEEPKETKSSKEKEDAEIEKIDIKTKKDKNAK